MFVLHSLVASVLSRPRFLPAPNLMRGDNGPEWREP